jgi:hypothetical protein
MTASTSANETKQKHFFHYELAKRLYFVTCDERYDGLNEIIFDPVTDGFQIPTLYLIYNHADSLDLGSLCPSSSIPCEE